MFGAIHHSKGAEVLYWLLTWLEHEILFLQKYKYQELK